MVTLKTAGKRFIKSYYSKPRASVGTQVEAALGHKSIKQVYAERSVPTTLTGTEKGIVVNQPRLKVQERGGGWARVTYTDPQAKGPITFSIRMNQIKGVMNKAPNRWFHPAEAVYSKWINSTKAGEVYTARRQVEGMLKASIKKGDLEMASKLEKILKKSDKEVAEFRQQWKDAHTDEEIEDFYEYDDEIVW